LASEDAKTKDLELDANKIAAEIIQNAQESENEQDLRQRVEFILRARLCEPMGIPWARYERRTVISGLRSDALYGSVILEYEHPDAFKTKSGFDHAIEQLKNYITEEAARGKTSLSRFFGVALDGFKIGFIRYGERLKDWDVQQVVPVNRYSVLKLLEAIRGLARKPLDADLMIKDFGPGSKVAKAVVQVFYNRITHARNERSKMLFNDWRRVFSQVCAYSPEKVEGLEEVYGMKKDKIEYEALLFAVHTYYALVMKLLAAEVAVLFGGFFLKSYTKKLEAAHFKSVESLWHELKELEQGGIFINLGIGNFLEADYFAWYLDEWDVDVANSVIDIVRKLSEYEPGTAELEPDAVRDLFKRLYQNLVPKTIRHDLGEYYTPDWLAELLLNEVGFTAENFEKMATKEKNPEAPLDLRLLDPACGSGTFLIIAIRRVKEYAARHFLEDKALGRIIRNIVGFDLNPLAVLASRANYLLALGELIRAAASPIELPIYFADSILAEKRTTFASTEYVLKTTVGTFSVPVVIVEKGLLGKALSLIETCVSNSYSHEEFKERAATELKVLGEDEVAALANLFAQVSKLEKTGKNGIWTRVLRNSFAPLFSGSFDYVVGNPPWVNWESLPEDYREASMRLYNKYQLITWTSKVGAVKTDLSILFTYVCLDQYLNHGGNFGFLITQSVFKSESAEGFRRFYIANKEKPIPLKVVRVHDMVRLKPFEGAQNRTSIIVILKGNETRYPVPYVLWKKKGRKGIDQEASLEDLEQLTERVELVAAPITKNTKSPWATSTPEAIEALKKVVQ
jgi:SAM-dependent methyltransferase